MTPTAFARELAATLAASLPDGFTVSADGELITIEPPDGAGVATALDIEADDSGDFEVYADAAEGVLSLVQDVVCEALDTTWPAAAGASVDLPIPGTRVDGATMQLWYGDDEAPVLRLKAIVLQA